MVSWEELCPFTGYSSNHAQYQKKHELIGH